MFRVPIKIPLSNQASRQHSQSLKGHYALHHWPKDGARGAHVSKTAAGNKLLGAAQLQTMEFSRLPRAPPTTPEPAEGSKRTREKPRPLRGPAHSTPPVLPPSSCRFLFFGFFWRQISGFFYPACLGILLEARARNAVTAGA